MELPGAIPIPNPKKIINPPEKNSLYFRRWNFLPLILKKFLIFSQKEAFLIFSQKKEFIIFPGTEPCNSVQALKIKELHSGKICYTSGNKNTEKNYLKVKQSFLKSKLFFCFGKRNPPPPPPPSSPNQKKNYISGNGTYISGKVYSDTFRTLVHSKP